MAKHPWTRLVREMMRGTEKWLPYFRVQQSGLLCQRIRWILWILASENEMEIRTFILKYNYAVNIKLNYELAKHFSIKYTK